MLNIKILGSGCPNCKKLEEETRKAVEFLSAEAEFEKVKNPREFINYDVMKTPGLVINGKTVSSGRIPSQSELMTMLTTALMEGQDQ